MIVNINNRKKLKLLIISLTFMFINVFSAELLEGEPLILSHEMKEVNIDNHISFYEDKNGSLTIEDIIHLPSNSFTRVLF